MLRCRSDCWARGLCMGPSRSFLVVPTSALRSGKNTPFFQKRSNSSHTIAFNTSSTSSCSRSLMICSRRCNERRRQDGGTRRLAYMMNRRRLGDVSGGGSNGSRGGRGGAYGTWTGIAMGIPIGAAVLAAAGPLISRYFDSTSSSSSSSVEPLSASSSLSSTSSSSPPSSSSSSTAAAAAGDDNQSYIPTGALEDVANSVDTEKLVSVLSVINPAAPLIAWCTVTLLSAFFLLRRMRVQFQNRMFLNRVNFSLNSLRFEPNHKAPKLVYRTLFEKNIDDLFYNRIVSNLVLKAARHTTAEQPFLSLPEHDGWFIMNDVLNELSRLSATGHLQVDCQISARPTDYVFGLTAEPGGKFLERKIRVLIVKEEVLREIHRRTTVPLLEDIGRFGTPLEQQSMRWHTLKKMAEIYDDQQQMSLTAEAEAAVIELQDSSVDKPHPQFLRKVEISVPF